jgi:prophage tail gpP-like protein
MILKINDRIRNRKVDFFNQFQLSLKYDSVASTFGFSFYYNPENQEHKEMNCVGHFHKATVEHNGELLVSGYLITHNFVDSPVKSLVQLGGYSLPGVLEDCEIPPDLYPLESNGLSLREIAQKLLRPFGIGMVVDSVVAQEMDAVFSETKASATQSIKGYLTELAAQKNIIISHDSKGNVLFTKAKTGQKPIIHFEKGIPGTSMSLSFNGQGMHSHITVMKAADMDGGNAGESTIRNPLVPIVYRPKVVIQSSGDDNDTAKAARNVLSQELKGLTLTIVTDRWEIDGKIIRPNRIISVKNPDLYIFRKTNFFIESVDFTGDNTQTTATLTCRLPSAYDGSHVFNPFDGWQEH